MTNYHQTPLSLSRACLRVFYFIYRKKTRCLQYMSEYSSCLLQGYGVLPGAPSRVKAPMIASRFAIIEWNAPKILPDTVTTYQVFVRRLAVGDEYVVIEKEHPPVILENLNPGAFYESYVVSVNAHGKGDPSPRIVFRTRREVSRMFDICDKFGIYVYSLSSAFV